MKRRIFLQQAGLSVASGAVAVNSATAQDHKSTTAERQQDSIPQLLITSAHTKLSQAIADALAIDYKVHLTTSKAVTTEHSFSQCNLEDQDSVNTLVRGATGIVHVTQPPDDVDSLEQLDQRTRETYNLLRSAVDAGVRHVLYLSSLELLTDYEEDFQVNEDWCPLPSEDARVLFHYLGEFTCREFAREGHLGVVVLRLGTVVRSNQVAGKPWDPMWIDQRDAVQAVSKAVRGCLTGNGPLLPWSVFHISSGSPQARFKSQRAQRAFGYNPQSP
jgi:hypothetical protein